MDKSTVIDKVRAYAALACANFPVKKVILFGSYANGNAHEYSDIDVAVVVEKIEGDLLDSKSKLFSLTHDIDVNIEPVLFDANSADLSGFLEEIQRTGEIIYSN